MNKKITPLLKVAPPECKHADENIYKVRYPLPYINFVASPDIAPGSYLLGFCMWIKPHCIPSCATM
jgi:hypothetical protein